MFVHEAMVGRRQEIWTAVGAVLDHCMIFEYL